MLIRELLNSSRDLGTEAEIILAKILARPRTYVLAHPEKKIDIHKVATFNKYTNRRRQGEPLSYIFGEAEFCGLPFWVNQDVLIPRPETEWIVDEAVNIIKKNPTIKNVIDVGTGSGAIILSIYRKLPAKIRASKKWLATDISKKAIPVAQKNARRFKTSTVKFHRANLLDANLSLKPGEILILANLPYLPEDDYRAAPNEVKNYEPKQALAAGKDGLKFYKPLIKQIAKLPARVHWIFEIDPCHAETIKKLARVLGPTELVKDFNSRKRYLVSLPYPPKITTA